jgi:hypothetical protein
MSCEAPPDPGYTWALKSGAAQYRVPHGRDRLWSERLRATVVVPVTVNPLSNFRSSWVIAAFDRVVARLIWPWYWAGKRLMLYGQASDIQQRRAVGNHETCETVGEFL